jgi:hypothetical protein
MTNVPLPTIQAPRPIIATLRQIAAWDLEHLKDTFEIKASVPALQRGLVWSPQQVELLWDSILRGFPIGSLVVSARLDSQERSGRTGITHHLLDGQQRCNAITLGFHDSFSDISGEVRGNESRSILWLDIAPEGIPDAPEDYEASHKQIPANSTREFLTRVTTKAHPWGYTPDDDVKRIPAAASRDALEWVYTKRPEKRPDPEDLLPWSSNAPVPMAWLLEAARNSYGAQDFWSHIIQRLELQDTQLAHLERKHRWTQLALYKLKLDAQAIGLERIHLSVRRVLETQIVILEAPVDIIAPSRQENAHTSETNISSIEHLFHRLNRQGTVLDGEELAYSLIKAYWPMAADMVENVKPRRVPASKLVTLAIRAALTQSKDDKVARGLSIPRLRAIANHTREGDRETRERIEAFLGCGENGARSQRLASACRRVDGWLIYHPDNHPHGLPAVLVSAIARNSADCYALFLCLADRLGDISDIEDRSWKQWMPGIATLLHWFAKPGEQLEIADRLLASMRGKLSPLALRDGLQNQRERLIYPPPSQELEFLLHLPDDAKLGQWRWWPGVIDPGHDEHGHQRETEWRVFFESTAWSREKLLYAQRSFLSERFEGYDPSRRDLWADHNRPWDFDHLHASAYFYNAKSGGYAAVCREWGNCIGNLRAWPFEDNRSDNKVKLEQKLADDPQKAAWSFINPEDIHAFSHGDSARHDQKAAHALCQAIKKRYLAIYEEWYSSTRIAEILPANS